MPPPPAARALSHSLGQHRVAAHLQGREQASRPLILSKGPIQSRLLPLIQAVRPARAQLRSLCPRSSLRLHSQSPRPARPSALQQPSPRPLREGPRLTVSAGTLVTASQAPATQSSTYTVLPGGSM